jgi:hypothetical protein
VAVRKAACAIQSNGSECRNQFGFKAEGLRFSKIFNQDIDLYRFSSVRLT